MASLGLGGDEPLIFDGGNAARSADYSGICRLVAEETAERKGPVGRGTEK